mmetsp:Transcript_43697/g.78453  ORF Transcript_43697/g.78453 Transcript_43697/m.78453 type:complete len:311 (+) Transcript_43697:223-1155(+)
MRNDPKQRSLKKSRLRTVALESSERNQCKLSSLVHLLACPLKVSLVVVEQLSFHQRFTLHPSATLVRCRDIPALEPNSLSIVVENGFSSLCTANVCNRPILDYLGFEEIPASRVDELADLIRANAEASWVLLEELSPAFLGLGGCRIADALFPYDPRHVDVEVWVITNHLVNHLMVVFLEGTATDTGMAPNQLQVRECFQDLLYFPEVLVVAIILSFCRAIGILVNHAVEVLLNAPLIDGPQGHVIDHWSFILHQETGKVVVAAHNLAKSSPKAGVLSPHPLYMVDCCDISRVEGTHDRSKALTAYIRQG